MQFVIILLFSFFIFVSNSFAAITFTNGYWSTTFNCSDWTQSGTTDPGCDSVELANDSAVFTDRVSRINADGNYAEGGGGKGWRTYYDGGAHNTMTSPMLITFPSALSEFWVRYYYRIPNGQTISAAVPAHKTIYLYGNNATLNINWPYYYQTLGIEVRGSINSDIVYGPSGARAAYVDITQGNWNRVYGGDPPTQAADGTWHCFEYYFNAGTTTSNGIFRMWIDGRNVVNDTAMNFGGSGSNWTHFYLPSNHNSFQSTSDLPNDVDDLAIATSSYSGFTTNTVGHTTGLNMIGLLNASPPAEQSGGRMSGGGVISSGGYMQ